MKKLLSGAFALFTALLFLVPVPANATTGYAVTLRNAQLDAITTFVGNAALVDVYDGTRPATCAAITTQVKLAEFTMGTPFAPASSGAVLTVTNPAATTGLAAGTATWYRIWKSGGTVCVMDGSAGTSGTDLVLNTATFSVGVAASISSFTITRGNP